MEPDFTKAPAPRPESFSNDMERFNAAVAHHDRALALRASGQLQTALAEFATALALAEHPLFHSNHGVTLDELERPAEALAAFDRALALEPDLAEAHANRGNALRKLGRLQEALAAHNAAIACAPEMADPYYYRALVLAELKHPAAALADYDKAHALNPDLPYLAGARLHQKMLVCDWRDFERDVADLRARIARGEAAGLSFPLLALLDDPALHAKAAALWAAKFPPDAALGPFATRKAGGQIRVGYFSMDFRDHPVAHLMAGVFETHDRTAFEVTAFSTGDDEGDAIRGRLEKAFDRFIDVRGRTDREIAALARSFEIDIAVDLAGYTGKARSGIFAFRAAPLQISYLGYPGTLASVVMDYVVADDVVIPPDASADYTEKVIALPCFQPSDSARAVAATTPSRAALGLPAEGVVFCCFNRAYKITPETFASWMRILERVPESVLWLSVGEELARDNLRKEAARHGIEPARLVFAERVTAMEDHLARHRAADLFLDTLPYSAHTTAGDALYVGLPVLTLPGQSFAARVSASLLRTLELYELIAETRESYEDLAVTLALDPARLAVLKAKLARNRGLLFDTARFTRRLEDAYRQVQARRLAGLAPEHISIV